MKEETRTVGGSGERDIHRRENSTETVANGYNEALARPPKRTPTVLLTCALNETIAEGHKEKECIRYRGSKGRKHIPQKQSK